MMPKHSVIEVLLPYRSQIIQKGVKRMALFGPAARNEDLPGGELHFLVEMDGDMTFERFIDVRNLLIELLGRPIELVMERIDHPEISPYLQDNLVEII